MWWLPEIITTEGTSCQTGKRKITPPLEPKGPSSAIHWKKRETKLAITIIYSESTKECVILKIQYISGNCHIFDTYFLPHPVAQINFIIGNKGNFSISTNFSGLHFNCTIHYFFTLQLIPS